MRQGAAQRQRKRACYNKNMALYGWNEEPIGNPRPFQTERTPTPLHP